MLLFFIIIPIILMPLLLLLRAKLGFSLVLVNGRLRASCRLGLVYGLIGFPFGGEWEIPELIKQALPGRRGGRGGLAARLAGNARRYASIDSIALHGRVGFLDDAFKSVVYSGALQCALEVALAALTGAGAWSAAITPDFAADVFCLNMEGMLTLRPAKIISIIFMRGEREDASSG